jgi:lipopolysaccharide transport system ATP-binding protein
MSNILEVHNVSKQYRLGTVGTGTLSHDLNRWFHKVRGKEDPYLKIGSANDRSAKADSDYVWALQDISFNVKEGEVLGIIGKNGAGKSTLLKILSRVTGPTTGSIKAYGRIASLLEVGTGFHPELTGRENIYLNGAILGMSKAEIRSKFDEIVDFSGCERYIDTPVKRYSSGMYVRLAFAVAAHLEPEILIVDEVLAVGDAEFQKKAIGKMKSVSQGEGRTVLFVSHNMSAVKSLCSKGIVLKNGSIVFAGTASEAVLEYTLLGSGSQYKRIWETGEIMPEGLLLHSASIIPDGGSFDLPVQRVEPLTFEISLTNSIVGRSLDITLHFKDGSGEKIFVVSSSSSLDKGATYGKAIFTAKIPPHFLNTGTYSIDLYVVADRRAAIYVEPDIVTFTLIDVPVELGQFMGAEPGAIRPLFNWSCNNEQ